ncbi:MAG: YqeG family HAD IIIA-type phosphatase [Clostridia bacterium]|nr:YqeG family HAD IIIA-type phosphatase [Clostridia bacterium]
MYAYLPDYIAKSIFEMDLEKLREAGVKGIAVDIDNTLVPMKTREPGPEAAEWIDKVKGLGFKVCILSNSRKHRTRLFMDKLGIHGIGLANKPGRRGYRGVAKYMGLSHGECAILGDQLFTDIKGGVRAGFVTVFTEYLDSNEILWVRLKRKFEQRLIKKHMDGIKRI